MAETVSVNLSGPALAFLLYENVKSKHEQEGFLLGDTNEIITKTITDTDSHNIKLHKIINVNAVVPCPKIGFFYNNVGAVDVKKLESFLGDKITNVVAWFRYELENKFKFSIRGKIVHRELSKCKQFSVPSDLFSCCLLTSVRSHFESTHTYTHTFIRYNNGQFLTVPLHINNLGESYNCYKPKALASKLFSELCKSVQIKNNEYDLNTINKIQDKLQNEIGNIMKDLTESEMLKEQLEKEFNTVRTEIEYHESIFVNKANDEAREKENRIPNLMDFDEEPETHKNLNNDLAFEEQNKMNQKKIEENAKDAISNDVVNSFTENLIDLTMDEDDFTAKEIKVSSTKKLSYAQITGPKAKTQTS